MTRFAKFAAGALLLSASPAALAQGAGWTVSEASGTVVVQDAGGKRAAQRGTVIAEGATLSTGAGARAVVVRGKDFMTVNANSRVRIPAAAEQRGVLDVLQDWGNAIFQIEKKPNPHFGVRTPYLAAVVKGTTFSITVTEQGSSLQVIEGAVETSTSDGGARELIRPGVVAIVSAADRYRLTVQGQDTRTIDSPQRGAAGAVAPAPAAPDPQAIAQPDAGTTADTQFEDVTPGSEQTVTEVAEVQMIDTPITASAADLGKITDGLVGGSTGVQIASVEVAAVRATTADLRNTAGNNGAGKSSDNSGNGNSNAGGNGNGSAGGNGNGNDNSGSGNINAGGNGNGNGNSGTDNSNAGGNGNGSDNSGSGNSNAGGNGNGNGNAGTDNSNAGGNGNGSDNSGSGNSNAGGNGNGNGNSGTDNSNAGGNGNGSDNSGSGNSNAGGNGNGNGNSGTDNSNAGGNGNGSDNSGSGNSNAGGNGNGNDNAGTDSGNAGGKGNGNGKSGTDDSVKETGKDK
jgi:hypothetical protein